MHEELPEAKGCALRQNESGDTTVLRYIPIVLSGVEMRVLPDLQEANGLARDESAGGDVSERIAIERFVVHIDIVAEIYRAIAGHPTRNVDPCDGYPVRQVDDLEVAPRNPCVDGVAIPSRRIFQNPGCKIADIIDPRAAMGVETIIVCEKVSRRGIVHVHRVRIRHVDLHAAERVEAAGVLPIVKFGERSDDQSTDCALISSSRAPRTRICIRLK